MKYPGKMHAGPGRRSPEQIHGKSDSSQVRIRTDCSVCWAPQYKKSQVIIV